jgi:hypothetical protein
VPRASPVPSDVEENRREPQLAYCGLRERIGSTATVEQQVAASRRMTKTCTGWNCCPGQGQVFEVVSHQQNLRAQQERLQLQREAESSTANLAVGSAPHAIDKITRAAPCRTRNAPSPACGPFRRQPAHARFRKAQQEGATVMVERKPRHGRLTALDVPCPALNDRPSER